MQVDLQQDYLSILTSIFHYIEIIPNTFAIELNNIIIRQIGARYFIKNMYNFFLLNADDCSISLAILSNPTVRTIKKHVATENGVTVISAMLSDPFGYGRIIRDEKGLSKIVEQKDATEEEQAVKEVNSGMYIFKCDALLAALSQITNDNAQGEYYLPDTIEIIKKMGLPVDAAAMEDADQIKGVNTLEQLAEAEEIMRSR